jgi:hypothetical protein
MGFHQRLFPLSLCCDFGRSTKLRFRQAGNVVLKAGDAYKQRAPGLQSLDVAGGQLTVYLATRDSGDFDGRRQSGSYGVLHDLSSYKFQGNPGHKGQNTKKSFRVEMFIFGLTDETS